MTEDHKNTKEVFPRNYSGLNLSEMVELKPAAEGSSSSTTASSSSSSLSQKFRAMTTVTIGQA